MKEQADTGTITVRLKRIEGQIRGIIKMIESDKSCEEVLIQIGSAKAGLHKAGQLILERYTHQCVKEGKGEGYEGESKDDETVKKLLSALEQFSRIV